MRMRSSLVLASLLGCVLLAMAFFPAQGGTLITVDTTDDEFNDDGDCSLREAIWAANNDSPKDACPAGDGADEIYLPAGTYSLSIAGFDDTGELGDLDIRSDLTLRGAGENLTVINGGVCPGPGCLGQTLIEVPQDPLYMWMITIQDLAIADNIAAGYVPGLHARDWDSTITLENCRFENNTKQGGNAGAVWNDATMVVRRCTFADNTAISNGGAIYTTGSLYVSDSTFYGNTATDFDGGAIAMNGGNLHVVNSTFNGNLAGRFGGAINLWGLGLNLSNVTISGNVADHDDYDDGSGAGDGGGIYVHSGLPIIRNSIIAGNTDNSTAGTPVVHPDCSGTVMSGGYNLIGDGTGCSGFTHGVNDDQVGSSGSPIDPLLDPSADNGGPTDTMAMQSTFSPAFNAGNVSGCRDRDGVLLDSDQRGYVRPSQGGCDIGAYEYNAPSTPNSPPGLLLTLHRSPASITKGSAASGPNQWFARLALSDHTGDPGLAFHYVVWLHVPEDWALPWATQYSFTGDFANTTLSPDWSAQSWVQDGNNCELGGTADAGFKWRAFRGPEEVLPALIDRLDNSVNLRGGLGVPGVETSDIYGGVRVVVGTYYDRDNDGMPYYYTCDHVAVTTISVP